MSNSRRDEIIYRIQALVTEQTRLETELKAIRCRYALALSDLDQEIAYARDSLIKLEKT
jgi:hypothetical protein